MKYYGDGITVKVYDTAGTLVDTRLVSYSSLTEHSDSTWTYTIPATDTLPYMYEITYRTVVDQDKVEGGGTTVTVSNVANGSGGIIAGSGGRTMTVLNIDTTNHVCGVLF